MPAVFSAKLGVPAEWVHRIRGELEAEEAATLYQDELARVFATPTEGLPPIFDLILLGMGADGHTASLFPYSQALTERRRWVVGNTVPRIGKSRVTMTFPILNRAAEVRPLVTGSDKAAALREALAGPREPERLPVQAVVPEGGRLIWLVDRAAAAELPTERPA